MPRAAKPPPELPCILVDTREQLPLTRYFTGAVAVQSGVTLPTGDYSVRGFTHCCAFERKSLADLVMSCASKERERFEDCLTRLSKLEHKAIVVESTQADVWASAYRSQATPQSIIGSTWAFLQRWGIHTEWAGNARGAARFIEWYALRLVKQEKAKAKMKESA